MVEQPTVPIRVCIVAPSLDILGGQAIQASRLLERLRDSAALEVGFLPVNPRLPGWLRPLQRMKYVRTIVTTIAYVASLLRRVPKYDIVHAFSASFFSFVLAPTPAILVGRLLGKRVVLNYRSGEAPEHLRQWRRTAVPTMRLANAIVTPSNYLVGVFAEHGLSAHAIANFVDRDRIPYRRRCHLRPRFLANRNLEPLYNVRCAIRAFGLVQRSVPDARLTIVGDGHERRSLEGLVRQLDLQGVTFVGQVAPSDMPRYYDSADLYLNAPDLDNMPTSIIEAFAAGLPVVTTDAGGIPHIVRNGENGFMVARGDAEGLAAAALRLLAEPELAESIALAARADYLRYYVWDAVRPAWEQLYRSLVGREGR